MNEEIKTFLGPVQGTQVTTGLHGLQKLFDRSHFLGLDIKSANSFDAELFSLNTVLIRAIIGRSYSQNSMYM